MQKKKESQPITTTTETHEPIPLYPHLAVSTLDQNQKKPHPLSIGQVLNLIDESRSQLLHHMGLKIYKTSIKKFPIHELFKRGSMLDEKVG